jgi:hypothetical protein
MAPNGRDLSLEKKRELMEMIGISSPLARVAAVAVGVAVAGLSVLPATAQATPARPEATTAASGYRTVGALSGVATVSASNAWAVGYTGSQSQSKPLMLHWNGKSWKRVTSPKILDGTAGSLSAITVVSARDAWAVGTTGSSFGHALMLHWNGKAWSQVTSVAGISGELAAVTATANSGWAVGTVLTPSVIAPLFLHWNGKTWSRVASGLNPASQGESFMQGVAVTAAKTAWAVGTTSQGIPTPVLGRWNGSTWRTDTSYPLKIGEGSFAGLAAGPGGTAFVVGNGEPGFFKPPVALSMRWTGKAWQGAPVSGAPKNSGLDSVAYAPGGTAWAAGYKYTSATGTGALLYRWTGKTWVSVALSGGASRLNGLGFAAAGNGWAVGGKGADTLILHWNGKAWN